MASGHATSSNGATCREESHFGMRTSESHVPIAFSSWHGQKKYEHISPARTHAIPTVEVESVSTFSMSLAWVLGQNQQQRPKTTCAQLQIQ